MALRRRQERSSALIWPGFVDAMTALLLVLMFVLTIFMVVQYVLQEELSGRDQSLAILGAEIQALNAQLSVSEADAEAARAQLDAANAELAAATARAAELSALVNRGALQITKLTGQLAESEADRDAFEQRTLSLTEQVAALELQLAERAQEAERQLLLIAAAEARADELEAAVADERSRDERALAFAQASLQAERETSVANRRAIALLNAQIQELRQELDGLRGLLADADARAEADQAVIKDLGAQLNRALAQTVSELQRYRSEFFGRVREILGDRAGVEIVGDRFVFQSEVLFDTGSAELGVDGKRQLSQVAGIIREVAADLPTEVNWILRVDGHTDSRPIRGGAYASNWELSQARALSVVQFLIDEEGLPAERLAPTGFGEYQPLDDRETAEAYRRNRRIELKLTER